MSRPTAALVLLVLVAISLLDVASLTYAARPRPEFVLPNNSPAITKHQVPEPKSSDKADTSCYGVGEEECLMRRSLDAHTDYIYTQDAKP